MLHPVEIAPMTGGELMEPESSIEAIAGVILRVDAERHPRKSSGQAFHMRRESEFGSI